MSDFTVDFIGIGSGKSGSTWLYDNIVKHPQICDKNPKEINYFNKDYLYHKKDMRWYRRQFRECPEGLLRGEFSVVYMYDMDSAGYIGEHFPDARILVILRDPVERIYSDYFHSIRKGETAASVPFSQYITDERNTLYGSYARYLEPYLQRFGAERMRVVLLEQVADDPRAVIRGVYEFLGVDPEYCPADLAEKVNQVAFYRSLWVETAMTRTSKFLNNSGMTLLVDKLKRLGLPNLVRAVNRKGRDKPPMPEADRQTLEAYFADSNARLAQALNVDVHRYWGRGAS